MHYLPHLHLHHRHAHHVLKGARHNNIVAVVMPGKRDKKDRGKKPRGNEGGGNDLASMFGLGNAGELYTRGYQSEGKEGRGEQY